MSSSPAPFHRSRRTEDGEHHGPFSFLNPTIRKYPLSLQRPKVDQSSRDTSQGNGLGDNGQDKLLPSDQTATKGEVKAGEVQTEFRTRDNRKGRHAIYVTSDVASKYLTPPATNTLKPILNGIWRMFSTCPYWDVSYLVAVVFTLGSAVWCINAFFVWYPLQVPSSEFEGEITDAGGITAFIGATIFEYGSILLMLEAVNENDAECFGWALETAMEENGLIRVRPDACKHHHNNKKSLVGKDRSTEVNSSEDNADSARSMTPMEHARYWTWCPTWYELRTHYLKEVGFLACLSQMIGATVFWISGFTALPPIYDRLTSTAAVNGAYWAPQVIGGTGFIVSGVLFMLETQKKWYLPAFNVLGWHIGIWNLLGGIGFTLCGALGFASANSGCVYQGSLATFWGSWCFLLGSVIQWFESLDKQPIRVEARGKAGEGPGENGE